MNETLTRKRKGWWRWLSFCLLLASATALHAQETLSSYRGQGIGDTLLAQHLIDSGNAVLKASPDSALFLYRQAARISKDIGYLRGRAVAWNNMSAAFKQENNFDEALLYLQQSMHIRHGDRRMFLHQCIDLCDLYYQAGRLQDIRNLYRHATRFFNRGNEQELKQLARLRKYMAIVYLRSGAYDSSFSCYYRTLADLKAPDSSDSGIFVETYNGMGAVSAQAGFHDQALYYFQAAQAVAIRYGDTNQLVMSLGNEAEAWLGRKEYGRAKELCLRTLNLARRMKYDAYQSLNASSMAVILNAEGRPQEALAYCREALTSARKIRHFDHETVACYNMGSTLLQLGRYQEAEQYLLPALKLAQQNGRIDNSGEAYRLLAEICARTGRYYDAYGYRTAYATVQDSLHDRESKEQIAGMELKYRNARKEEQLARQQLRLNQAESRVREKNLWMGSMAFSAGLMLVIGIGWFRHRRKIREGQMRHLLQQQEIERLNARMQGEEAERGRIAQELHDGVSVLLSAARMNYTALGREHEALASSDTYREVMHLLNETGQELRAVSWNLVPELLLKQSLPAAVQAFCGLISRGHQLNIEVQSYGSFTALEASMTHTVYRIVQELVHNIVRHAQASAVLLQLTVNDPVLYLTVEDNGIGFEEGRSPAGMGLQNIRDRVKALNGQLMVVSGRNTGTTIEIEIPINH